MNNEILREDLMEEKTIGKPETTSELIQERRTAQRAAAARKSKRATITAVATAVLATATATVIMVFASCGANKTSSSNKATTVATTTAVVTTVAPTTAASTTVAPTTVKTTQPTTKAIRAEAVGSEKTEDNEDAEDGSHSYISSNVDNGTVDAGNDYNSSEVNYNAQYSPDKFQNSGVISWGGYDWTYYSELILPGDGLNIPGRHTTEDGYVCDGDGYVVLAADLSLLPRYSVVDTPFGREGKVYDTGCAYGVLDVYVGW